MKKIIGLMMFSFIGIASSMAFAEERKYDVVPDVAEYQGASWDNLVKIERNITVEEAYAIADSDPNINYFFRTKALQLVLDTPVGRQFLHNGDTVFFSGQPWWGEAKDLADGYVKQSAAY